MKKLILCLIFSIVFQNIFSQNIEEIMAKYEKANGGKESFNSVKTLQYNTVMKMNMMGMPLDINIINIAEAKKLYRKEMAGMMGMKGSYTIVTDTAGYVFTPNVPSYGEFQGLEGGLKKMENIVLAKAQQKLDPMYDFGALVDYYSKGSQIELAGTSKIDKTECYKLKYSNKNGETSVYYIDTTTLLIKQIELSGKQVMLQLGLDGSPMYEMMGARIDKQKMAILFLAYRDVDGIKFPSKQRIQFGAVDIDIENTDIEINQPINQKWYKIN